MCTKKKKEHLAVIIVWRLEILVLWFSSHDFLHWDFRNGMIVEALVWVCELRRQILSEIFVINTNQWHKYQPHVSRPCLCFRITRGAVSNIYRPTELWNLFRPWRFLYSINCRTTYTFTKDIFNVIYMYIYTLYSHKFLLNLRQLLPLVDKSKTGLFK